jgi:putative ABC transport system permease protein
MELPRVPAASAYLIGNNSMQSAWLEYLTAFRSVTRQYRRTVFGLSAVTFGVVALVLAAGFIEWIFWATREGNIQNGLGHIHITRAGYLREGHADPWRYLLPPDAALQQSLRGFPSIRTIAPRLSFSGLISHGDATLSFIGEGVDPAKEREVSRTLTIVAGQNLSPDDPKGILLGRGLADNLGVKVGDTVVLLSNTATGAMNGAEGIVRGLFYTVSKAYDDSALRVPLPIAQALVRVSGVHQWILVLNDTDETAATTAALRAAFRGRGLEVTPWYDLADFYNKVVGLLSRQLAVVKLIIAVIIVLSISNTMMMNVLERTAEIGTSMAIGRRRRQILRQFVYEGLTVGFLGGVLGIGLAWLLGSLISYFGIPMPPPPGMSQGYTGRILLSGGLSLEAFLLALATSLVASLYPAWRASRIQIVDALRHNR